MKITDQMIENKINKLYDLYEKTDETDDDIYETIAMLRELRVSRRESQLLRQQRDQLIYGDKDNGNTTN